MIRPHVAVAALVASACGHVPRVQGLDVRVRGVEGGYVTGEVAGLERVALLDNKDFIYSIAVSPGAEGVALTRLQGQKFQLGLWSLAGGEGAPRPLAEVAINEYAFDVEALSYSPDGKWVVTAGRDGAVRAYRAIDGQRTTEFFSDEPLVSIAFVGDALLAAGSARGLVTLLTWPELRFVSESRVHSGEVRALIGLSDRRVVSGSWDKTIAVLQVTSEPLDPGEVRLTFEVTQSPSKAPAVRAGLDGCSGRFAYDAAAPQILVTSELARRAGIEPSALAETVSVGGQLLRVARGRSVQLKHVNVPNVDVAICDACVPAGLQGILGSPVLGSFEVRAEPSRGELVLTARQKPDPSSWPDAAVLRELKRHRFESYVNDLTVDRAGKRLGVAFSAEKAERNRAVYEREKRGKDAPFDARDMTAIVDLQSGAIARRWMRHLGPVSSVAISPDGRGVASAGWDKRLYLFRDGVDREIAVQQFGWILRRVRFSADGRLLAAAAWTPTKALSDQESDPSAVLYEVLYSSATIARP
jgi:WD40 repeat protein